MYILGLVKFFLDSSYALSADIRSLLLPNSDIIVQNNICACGRRHAYLQDVIQSNVGEYKVRDSQPINYEAYLRKKWSMNLCHQYASVMKATFFSYSQIKSYLTAKVGLRLRTHCFIMSDGWTSSLIDNWQPGWRNAYVIHCNKISQSLESSSTKQQSTCISQTQNIFWTYLSENFLFYICTHMDAWTLNPNVKYIITQPDILKA